MPDFTCVACSNTFTIPDDVLARYPGWKPRYCKLHKPKASSADRGASGGNRGSARRSSGSSSARRPASVTREENLTLAEVLAKYTNGPASGVFTDGGCTPNPGPGGWGLVWVENGEVLAQKHGHDPNTTNNRMEMTAIITALELLPDDASVTLYTDSKLCVDTLNSWAAGWERNGWTRKTGPIKNLDLVQRAFALKRAHPKVKIEHIRAHSGDRWNEYADSLATAWQRSVL